ncbi:cysteine hydrolase family protein [Stenotrophomonas bentonitica]|uniref:cysteine hydrolase family protein n=1 Tax=Stenotrophomonas bentonitica TaxID=1450134 RepID=UPI00345E89B1
MAVPVLLIIDLFSRFDFPDADRLAPMAVTAATNVAQIRKTFDDQGWPVVYANDNFGDWKCGFRDLAQECLDTPGPPHAIAELLFPGPDHYSILKPKHSAFLSTPLQILLEKLDAGPLVLTGMALDSCVLATAIDANSREMRSVVVEEATAALPERKAASLLVLKESGVATISTISSLALLLSEADLNAAQTTGG